MAAYTSSFKGICALDQTTHLPAALFKNKQDVAITLIVHDTKTNFKMLRDGRPQAMQTCEFGLGSLSEWGLAWGTEEARPLNRAVEALNKRGIKVWMMVTEEVLAKDEAEQERSFLVKFQKALMKSPLNHLSMKSAEGQPFPTPYIPGGFDSKKLSTYYGVGYTSYWNLPASHFANISGEFPRNPRILMMDGGIGGSINCVLGYKFLSRLAMNGTEAASQIPPYVIIESVYRKELAQFLKMRFPKDERLVLKHAASSRGEGVVVMNAIDEKTLDTQLQLFLSEGSGFKKVSPLSICLVEKFISVKEKTSRGVEGECMTRMVYMAIRDQGQFELRVIDGVKAIEDSTAHENASTHGLVKLSKWNAEVSLLNDDELQLVQHHVAKEISAIAKRAMQYDLQAALKYFLKHNEHILNLVGVELFTPSFVCSYRERVGQYKHQLRLSDEHCDLLSSLLQRNESPLLMDRIFDNCIKDIANGLRGIPYAHKFPDLVETFWKISRVRGRQGDYEGELQKLYQELVSKVVKAFPLEMGKEFSLAVAMEFSMEKLISLLRKNVQ